jgi:hypothetical protein
VRSVFRARGPLWHRLINLTADCFVYSTNVTKRVWLAMEDDCWNIEALRGVNSLAPSVVLKKSLMVSVRLSLI